MSVPMLSNSSTMVKVKMIEMMPYLSAPMMSSCMSVGARLGREKLITLSIPEGAGDTPNTMPSTAVTRMPMSRLPWTLRAMSPAVSMRPQQASSGPGWVTWPRATTVASFFTTMPAFWSPMKAMNMPMPTTMAYLRFMGTASMSSWRTCVTVSSRNTMPEKNTAPRATVQCRPRTPQT